jgi:hypothetical protein
LKVPDDLAYDEKLGEYALKSGIILKRAGIALFLILAVLPPQALAKCPTQTAEVHGRLCFFSGHIGALVLLFNKLESRRAEVVHVTLAHAQLMKTG